MISDSLQQGAHTGGLIEDDLIWIAAFAELRAADRSEVFARVNREALRTIAKRARAAIAKATPQSEGAEG